MGDEDAEARRQARADWQATVFHGHEQAREADVVFWLAIPRDERASFVWKLSQEVFGEGCVTPDTRAGRRLRRSVVCIVRRKG
jgi:hypothetical protein